MEEEAFFEYSSTIIAKNKLGVIVGAIRINHWNNNPHMLPLVKIFGNEIVIHSYRLYQQSRTCL